MTPFRKAGKQHFTLYVPTRHGSVKRSAGTRDAATAKAMARMIADLGPRGKRRWDLLDAVADRRLSVAELYDAFVVNDLEGLVARLSDVDLRPLLPAWSAWARDRVAPATVDRYELYLASLVPDDVDAPWWRSSLTSDVVATWLASRLATPRKKDAEAVRPVSGPTKRKYAAALASFVAFLRERRVLDHDPLAGISLPPAREPRPESLEREEVARLVSGAPLPFSQLYALIYGTGAEVSAALAIRRRDIDLGRWMIRMPGTKTHNRDRVAIVAEWARPAVRAAAADLLPDGLLFAGVTRSEATKVHARTLKALGIRHLKLHAARNHWAVRAIRGGWSLEAVARQLGNTPEMVMRVYGRFVPTAAELARLETAAEREDQRRVAEGW